MTRLRIAVLGYIVRGPIGGLAWHHLQYVLGLARLGHDVRFVEDSDDYPACYDPSRHLTDTDPTYGLSFAADAFERFGMGDTWSYHDAHTGRWLGGGGAEGREFCESADIALNLSGMNPMRDWTRDIPVRVLVDTDPVFMQVRHLTNPAARERAKEHNRFFTFAENVERGTALIPDDGFNWKATRQPIVLDLWQVTSPPPDAHFTTVMQWESYPAVEHNGIRYGTKSASFQSYLDLPRRTDVALEVALGGEAAPRDLLRANGWSVADPLSVARTPWDYQRYIANSRGELAVAKQGYVASRSGWFSERSAAFLASGRPVVTQDTGFTDWLPAGCGVVAFENPEETLAALKGIERDYANQSQRARELAEEYFDSSEILSRLIKAATTNDD